MSLILSGSNGLSDVDGSASTPAIRGTDANTGIFFPAADTIAFAEGGTESMRLDSNGNVGIGTSSPSSKLTVGGNPPLTGAIAGVASAGGRSLALSDNTNSSLYVIHTSPGIATFGTDFGGALAFATNGTTERARITSGGDFQFNSGYGSVATAYGCRAWVNFNGTGTVSIRASGNVTSITDNGVGTYTVNFTNAMPDANYTWVMNGRANAATGFYTFSNGDLASVSASSFPFYTLATANGGTADQPFITVAIFR